MPTPTSLRRTRVAGTLTVVLALLFGPSGIAAHGGVSVDPSTREACGESSRPWLPHSIEPLPSSQGRSTPALRVVTYNIHSGLGAGFSLRQSRERVQRNLEEIARDIAASAPPDEPVEIVALNEVDFASRRSGWFDQADFLATQLARLTGRRYDIVRGETWQRELPGREVRFGNALLVRLPIVSASSCLLGSRDCDAAPPIDTLPSPAASGWRRLLFEERGVLKVSVRFGDKVIDLLVTHLDAFSARVREAQAMHLLHRFVDPGRTTVLLGDLNAVATELTGTRRYFGSDRTLDILTSNGLADARTSYASLHGLGSIAEWPTYPSAEPMLSLDTVLASVDLAPQHIAVIGRTASDHRGLMVQLAPVVGEAQVARARTRHEQVRLRQRERIEQCDLATKAARRERGWLVADTGFSSLPVHLPAP